ncbi:hypothetical protein Hamer_G029927, partial [Homarus americanus]
MVKTKQSNGEQFFLLLFSFYCSSFTSNPLKTIGRNDIEALGSKSRCNSGKCNPELVCMVNRPGLFLGNAQKFVEQTIDLYQLILFLSSSSFRICKLLLQLQILFMDLLFCSNWFPWAS